MEALLYPRRYWIPGDDPRHRCGNGKPLLDGRADGYHRGLPGFSLQQGLAGTPSYGRCTAMDAQGRKADSVDRRCFSIKGRSDLMTEFFSIPAWTAFYTEKGGAFLA